MSQPLKMLIYGLPGAGKTRFVSSAALDERLAPVLYLDCMGNPISIDYAKRPKIIPVRELKDYNDPFDWLETGQPPNEFAKQFELVAGYKTLIVDQITETQRLVFDKSLGMRKRRGQFDTLPVKREWDHYYSALHYMIDFAKLHYSLADYGINVILVAQERNADDDAGRPVGPLLEGQGQVEVSSYAEIIGRVQHITHCSPTIRNVLLKEDSNAVNIVWFKQSEKFMAKDQTPGMVLSPYIINPTMTEVMDRLG